MPKESELDATQTGANLAGNDEIRFVDVSGPTSEGITVDEFIQGLALLGNVPGGLVGRDAGGLIDDANLSTNVVLWDALTEQAGYIDPRTYGAALDCQHIDDIVLTNGSTTATSASGAFLAEDEDKVFIIPGGAAANGTLVGTFETVVNAGQVTLSVAAGTSIAAGTDCYWGTDDTTGLQATITAAAALRVAVWLPASCLVTAPIDARVPGLKIFGVQGYVDVNMNVGNQSLGQMARSTIVSTYGGASDAWLVSETPGHEYTNIGFIFPHAALDRAMNFENTGTPRPTQQHRFRNCLFGQPVRTMKTCDTLGIYLDGCWSVVFDTCIIFGFDDAVWCADPDGEGFSNSVSFRDCSIGVQQNYSIRYPGEGFLWSGGAIQRMFDDLGTLTVGLRFLAVSVRPDNTTAVQLAGDTNVTIVSPWISDVGAASSSTIIIGAEKINDGGSITVIGGRTGGDQFIDFKASNCIPVSLQGINHSGGVLIDWNSFIGNTVHLTGIGDGTTSAIYTGTIGSQLGSTGYNSLHIAGGATRFFQVTVGEGPGGADLGVGDGQAWFVIPESMDGWSIVTIEAKLATASASGGPILVQLRNATQAVDVLSTRLTIDDTETSSKTAAAAPAFTAANQDVVYGDLLYIDIDDAGTTANGLIVTVGLAPLNNALVV
jgi:hypothetical protein